MRVRNAAVVAATAALAVSGLAACSSSGGGGGGNEGTGPITFVTGKDNSNVWPYIAKRGTRRTRRRR